MNIYKCSLPLLNIANMAIVLVNADVKSETVRVNPHEPETKCSQLSPSWYQLNRHDSSYFDG